MKPQDIHEKFEKAFNAGDMDALAALYEPSAILLVNGEEKRGTAAIREALSGFLALQGKMTLRTAAVMETGDGLAMLHGKWNLDPPGMQGVSSEVVRRQGDGTWVYIIDNPFTPAP